MHTPVTTRPPTAAATPHPHGWWGRGSLLAALLWSIGTALLALGWSLGAAAHPFADADAVQLGALLNAFPTAVGIAVTGGIGVVGAVAAAAALRRRRAGIPAARGSVALAWGLAAVVLLTMVDGRFLALLGYVPVVLTVGWVTPGLQAAFVDAVLTPETLLLLSGVVGGVAWASTALSLARARRGACPVCGRGADWTPAADVATRRRALRTGRIAIAAGIPFALVYPSVRIPWLFGIPVGMDEASWALLQAEGMRPTGVALGTAGAVGALLMLGLVMTWGVRFPRWVPLLAGRRVAVSAAVVPAAVVSIALLSLGRGILPTVFSGDLPAGGEQAWVHGVALAAMLPWGLALAVATGAYALRRRAECDTCGRGLPESAQPPSTAGSSAREAIPSF